MTTLDLISNNRSGSGTEYQVQSSLRFDWSVMGLSTVFTAGLFLDGWAHNNISNLIETFFTPYHALLYGGYLLVAILLVATFMRNVAKGTPWAQALPGGYMSALVGVAIFSAGGIGDLVWHELFGFEDDIEALLSPTHLMLAAGAFLFVSAPLRAVWMRENDGGVQQIAEWRRFGPVLISMTILLSLLTFFTQYATYARPDSLINPAYGDELVFLRSVHGLFQLLVPTALVTGSILFLIRRWQMPAGSLFLLIGVNYTLMFLMTFDDAIAAPFTLPATVAAGVVIDLLYRRLQPAFGRLGQLRWFAFLIPFTLVSLHLITLLATHGLWWQIHMWAGAPYLAGVVGLLLSYLSHPAPIWVRAETKEK